MQYFSNERHLPVLEALYQFPAGLVRSFSLLLTTSEQSPEKGYRYLLREWRTVRGKESAS